MNRDEIEQELLRLWGTRLGGSSYIDVIRGILDYLDSIGYNNNRAWACSKENHLRNNPDSKYCYYCSEPLEDSIINEDDPQVLYSQYNYDGNE